jgi:hypothetical protein
MELRSRALPAIAVAFAIGVAACGGSGSSAAPGTSEAPASSQAGTATEGPTLAPVPTSAGTVDFGDAATKLSSLDSYTFDVQIVSQSTTASGVQAGSTEFSGTMDNKNKAEALDIVEKDGSGTVTSESHFILLPDSAYTKDGGTWTAVPAAQASIFTQAFAAFQPVQLFSIYWLPGVNDNSLAGEEQKNGVDCLHLKGATNLGTILSGITGVSSSWSSDVWIAKDGGYLVHSEIAAVGADGTSSGQFSILIDINKINGVTGSVVAPS